MNHTVTEPTSEPEPEPRHAISTQAAHIACRIAHNIHGHRASGDAFVVSLYGEWGVGKTYCLKGIAQWFDNELQRIRNEDPNTGGTAPSDGKTVSDIPANVIAVPVLFSPWQYEKEAHLIIPLLKTVELELQAVEEKLPSSSQGEPSVVSKMRALFSYFATDFEAKIDWTSLISKVLKYGANAMGIPGPLIELFNKIVTTTASTTVQSTGQTNGQTSVQNNTPTDDSDQGLQNSQSIYYEFHQQLSVLLQQPYAFNSQEYKIRLVILIDDLDRCLPEKSIEMLESIKLFLNVPGLSFVLAVDDDIVERGIRHRYANYIAQSSSGRKQTDIEDSEDLPINGHEYLEKIIHLPQHINRLPEAYVEKMLQKYELFQSTVHGEQNTGGLQERHQQEVRDSIELIQAVVPSVPRKIIRLAEAVDFQYHSLTVQLGSKSENALKTAWDLPTAVRTQIIAQLYPNIYRQMRYSEPPQVFWQMFYSLDMMSDGKVGYRTILHYRSIDDDTTDNASQNSNSAPATQADKPAVTSTIWSRQQLQQALDHKQLPDNEKPDATTQAIREYFALDDNTSRVGKKYSLRELIQFMGKIEQSIQGRNGDGLLRLWDKTSRTHQTGLQWRELIPDVLKVSGMDQYRALYLGAIEGETLGELINRVKEMRQPAASVADSEDGASDPKSSLLDIQHDAETVLTVADKRQWLEAILSGSGQQTNNYLEEYARAGEAADAAAFSELLTQFNGLTAKAKHNWLKTPNEYLSNMLSANQRDYLCYIANAACGWQTPGTATTVDRFEPDTTQNEILDHWTGLYWQIKATEALPWDQVTTKTPAEEKQAGLPQASLPSARQLQTLIDYSEHHPALDEKLQNHLITQDSDYYWALGRWCIDFDDGYVYRRHLGIDKRVRLVRGVARSVSGIEDLTQGKNHE